MRLKNTLGFVCFIGAAIAMSAKAASQDSLDDCSAYSQAEMSACLTKKADQSAAALKAAVEMAARAIDRWDDDARHLKAARQKLAQSNKAFERFRETQCAFATALGGGAAGNALSMRSATCVHDMNKARTEQLIRAASTLPQK